MNEARIQILIPTFNCVNALDETMQSILGQDFPKENIYITIVDFGSEDGTYEKAMNYNLPRLGVYSRPFQKKERQRIADGARLLGYVHPGGKYCFSMVVYPGETLYPQCFKRCSEAWIANYHMNLSMIVCEVDVKTADGKVHHQMAMRKEDCIIDGSTELSDFVSRGYNHHIIQMVQVFLPGRYKGNQGVNEGRCWSKLARGNQERNVFYISEPMACVKEIAYDDELEEILNRWESYISIIRFFVSSHGYSFDENFENVAKKNLAFYALWRSFVLYQRDADLLDIENCFLIASVIDEGIKDSKLYKQLETLYENPDSMLEKQIQEYFFEEM